MTLVMGSGHDGAHLSGGAGLPNPEHAHQPTPINPRPSTKETSMLRSFLFRRTTLSALAGAMILCAFAFQARAADPSAVACAGIAAPDQKRDATTIQRIEQAWLTAEYHGHREYLACLLEPDYQTSSRSGLVRSRQDVSRLDLFRHW
jgi:hypothetical protein